ncbi:transporter substrate-binding domain-containing protein [Ectothiorhodospiraceae bacterium 2226]|nr:transporter substrate-binding domain-containing protein [Ectothiorhodospiraceae bacterium 2226]
MTTRDFFRRLAYLCTPAALLAVAALSQTGCSSEESAAERERATAQQTPLRVITLRQLDGPDFLPRSGLPDAAERELLGEYAAGEGRAIEWVLVDSLTELFAALEAGRGDLAAANLTITETRMARFAFSAPIAFVREVVIGRTDVRLESPRDLRGQRVAAFGDSSFQETLQRIHAERFQEPFEIVTAEGGSDEALLDGVANGSYELAVLDSNTALALLPGREDLHVALTLPDVRPVGWAVRRDAPQLLASVNRFLSSHQLLSTPNEIHTDDLDGIAARGVLRVATRNNAANYFLFRGELMGFEYELAKRFADSRGLRLAVVVPPSHAALRDWVRDGHADLAAASLTISAEGGGEGMVFSRPYHRVTELLVTRADDLGIQSADDLAGRTVVVRRNSSYWRTLSALREAGYAFELVAAAEDLETEQIIDRVGRGEYDLTVADSHIVEIEQTYRDDIRAAFALTEEGAHGWLMRADNPQLVEAVNGFLRREYRGVFYNLTRAKYFGNDRTIQAHVGERVDGASAAALSPYDELVRRYAERYGFDWRLVVAQMYQESRFDPAARSWAGALGLMQVLPRTGRELGFDDLHDPDSGIHAGVQYMDWLMRRFEPELNMADRTWFALAAYNAGIGHVRDARRLAAQKGWASDQWFDNVEHAMLLLAQREYHRHAAHGYVRGQEPVNYVRHIRDRFEAYARLTEQ